MRTIKEIVEDAKRTGEINIAGELSFNYSTLYGAMKLLQRIAGECGYVVQRVGACMLRAEGGGIPHRHCVELEWNDPASIGPDTIRLIHNVEEESL